MLSTDLNAFLKDEIKDAMVHEIPVTQGSGIRAIEPLDDGFLVLTGTSQVDMAIKGECAEVEVQEPVQPALYFWGGKQDPGYDRSSGSFLQEDAEAGGNEAVAPRSRKERN